MTIDQARTALVGDGPLADRLEAIAVLAHDPQSMVADLVLGLSHPECVAEQAALALYRRTGRPLPEDSASISTDPEDWIVWLIENKRHPAARHDAPTDTSDWATRARGLTAAVMAGAVTGLPAAKLAAFLADLLAESADSRP